ncbi:MAG TPA: hypothetical protein VM122_08690 [Usitatibacter sp.]|nr:hypothetical protein [Usitatibacter sp.]
MKPLSAVAAAVFATFAAAAQAGIGNLADVSIVDRASGRELPVHWHEGRAYVVGKPGNEYQVTARNRRGEDLLAVISVDGVNVLSGDTASAGQQGYILASWSRFEIKGWRKSLGEIAAFYFTSLGDSYAARTDRPGNVGVIGVALFRRAPAQVARNEAPPAPHWDSPREKAEGRSQSSDSSAAKRLEAPAAAAAPPLGTGHGRREESHVTYAEFERASRTPAETIAIYYDSYRNLVARGVLASPTARRDPDPFPARFAPDPWR